MEAKCFVPKENSQVAKHTGKTRRLDTVLKNKEEFDES